MATSLYNEIQLVYNPIGYLLSVCLPNNPELMQYARQTSTLSDGIIIEPGSGLTKGIASLPVGVDLKYAYINDAEADKLRYLKEKGDTEGIEKYLQLIDRDLNERQTKGDMALKQQGYDQLGWVGKVGAGVDSFGNSFNTGLAFLDTAANGLKQRFGGQYEKPDVYSPWQRPANMKRMDREYVTQDMSPILKTIVNGGMDIAEATPKLMIPGIGLPLMAVSDAGDVSNEALREGDDYQTATGKATAKAIFDYFTGKAAAQTYKYFKGLNKTPEGVKIGGKEAAEGANKKAIQLAKNYAQGKAFEKERFLNFDKTHSSAQEQITIQTNSRVKTRVDAIGFNSEGKIEIAEFKSSATAPLTANQKIAFPEIYESGGTVIGKGKGVFIGGYKIPPGIETKIIRP